MEYRLKLPSLIYKAQYLETIAKLFDLKKERKKKKPKTNKLCTKSFIVIPFSMNINHNLIQFKNWTGVKFQAVNLNVM